MWLQYPEFDSSKACVSTYVQSTKEYEVQINEVWDLRMAAPTLTLSYSAV
jgi:hypothetical protein